MKVTHTLLIWREGTEWERIMVWKSGRELNGGGQWSVDISGFRGEERKEKEC